MFTHLGFVGHTLFAIRPSFVLSIALVIIGLVAMGLGCLGCMGPLVLLFKLLSPESQTLADTGPEMGQMTAEGAQEGLEADQESSSDSLSQQTNYWISGKMGLKPAYCNRLLLLTRYVVNRQKERCMRPNRSEQVAFLCLMIH